MPTNVEIPDSITWEQGEAIWKVLVAAGADDPDREWQFISYTASELSNVGWAQYRWRDRIGGKITVDRKSVQVTVYHEFETDEIMATLRDAETKIAAIINAGNEDDEE